MPTNPNWSEAEDQELRRLVEEYGPKKWSLIATKLKTKGSKQCRRRWKNYLNADLKQGGWSPEEDHILIEGHKKYGNRWTEIAKLVGGRTDNAVKNRWAALCKRSQRLAKGIVPTRGRKPRSAGAYRLDTSSEEEDTPPPSPRTSPRYSQRLQQPIHQLPFQPIMARGFQEQLTGKRPHAGADQEPLAKRQQFAYPGSAPNTFLATSPRSLRALAARSAAGPSSPQGHLKAKPRDSPPDTTSQRSRGSSQLTSPSAARKGKPQLTLLIPNAAADPPAAAAPTSLEIHVMKDLLSPQEVRYVQELNGMDIPLHINLGDPLEPPLSTSRRAAQDAISALVAGSPTGGLGPLSLCGGLSLNSGGIPWTLPSATGSGGSDFGDLLRWFQQGFTPRSTRALGGVTSRSRGAHDNWASPVNPLVNNPGLGPQSPRPVTRSAAKAITPRACLADEPRQMSTPRTGSAHGSGTPKTPKSGSQIHDGHKQLLNKLLVHAKAGMEEAQVDPHTGQASETTPPKQQLAATTRQTRMSPRVQQSAQPAQPISLITSPRSRLTANTAQPTAPVAAAGTPGRSGRQSAAGRPATQGPPKALNLSNLAPLPSPRFGEGLGSTKGGPSSSWMEGLSCIITPTLSPNDISALLDLLQNE